LSHSAARFTALFHWYISFSVYNSIVCGDGGDQVTATLTFLLLPLALLDPRRWHWENASAISASAPFLVRITANAAAFLVQLQVSVIYVDSCIAKITVPEWSNGTELYYVMMNNYIGASSAVSWIVSGFVRTPGVVVATWTALVLEFLLGINLLLAPRARRTLFWFGIAFHAAIALFIGIPTFALAMFGALLLGVVPIGTSISELTPRWKWLRSMAPGTTSAAIPH
jgi:antimicrobial peptide system SdpB family protein